MPRPSSARPATRPPALGASANTTQPTTVIATETSMQSFGPKRSSATPSGNCTAAKTKKYMLDSSPSSSGESAISAARLGAITATELRRNWLTM